MLSCLYFRHSRIIHNTRQATPALHDVYCLTRHMLYAASCWRLEPFLVLNKLSHGLGYLKIKTTSQALPLELLVRFPINNIAASNSCTAASAIPRCSLSPLICSKSQPVVFCCRCRCSTVALLLGPESILMLPLLLCFRKCCVCLRSI